jgi:hypothetical protein
MNTRVSVAWRGAAFFTAAFVWLVLPGGASPSPAERYDINTLAGKVASVHGTAGLLTRMSAFLEEEASDPSAPATGPAAITPTYVLTSPLDGTTVASPVTGGRHPEFRPQVAGGPTSSPPPSAQIRRCR